MKISNSQSANFQLTIDGTYRHIALMRAILVREFGEPEVMKLEDIEMPQPGAGQVLIKIYAAGVNPVDTYLRTGIHAHAPKLPYTPGKDGAGFIESIGDTVTKLKTGDRVYAANSISGTYAEFSLCDEKHLSKLPDDITFEEGAGVWTPYATSYRALFQKAGAIAGETVLIHGASGGVGIAAVQWAKQSGLTVIGTASSDTGKALVETNGADAVFDHSDIDHLFEIREFTGGKGADVIIEMLANENLERDFEALAMFGRIVVVGSRGTLDFTPRQMMTKDATIYGMSLFNASQESLDEIHAAIYEGLSKGFLKPPVSSTFSLADAPAAHHEIIEKKAAGKIVIKPQGE
ncbi:zinc-dependent alcohol dehydrogenase family protein [soil metagenome]